MSTRNQATKSRSQGREGWCAIFRHPLKLGPTGQSVRVRRGLGTRDEDEADRLLSQLNQLLSDNAFWSPAARATALRKFDSKVVEIFFDGLVARPIDEFGLRDEVIPLPGAEVGYAKVLILGPTGAGKTTLLRQLIGSDPRSERFPSTSKSKTTTAQMEFVLAEGPFRAVVTFMSYEVTRLHVDECVVRAMSLSAQSAKESRIVAALLEHENQRFRLSYILGTLESADEEVDEWAEPAPVGEMESGVEVDHSERNLFRDRLLSVVAALSEAGGRLKASLEEQFGTTLDKYKAEDVEAFLECLEEEVRRDAESQRMIDDIVEQVHERFELLDGELIKGGDSDWPTHWVFESEDREAFIRVVNRLTSNYAPNFGRLLTPLVTGVRVSGPFHPSWIEPSDSPRLVLFDGEGLGHTPDSAASLPTQLTQMFDRVDMIVLVDNAQQPMLAGPSAVLRTVTAAGHDSKLALVFTHFDQMHADNLRTTPAKKDHVRRSVDNALGYIETALGGATVRGLRHRLESRVFYAGNLHESLSGNPPGAKFTKGELEQLLAVIGGSIAKPEPVAARPRYHTANLVLCIQKAVENFLGSWEARLGVVYRPSAPRPEHWTRLKALSRRLAELNVDSYADLMPVADLLKELTESLAQFVASPLDWEPPTTSETQQSEVIEQLRRALSKRLYEFASARVWRQRLLDWKSAFQLSGPGSGQRRASSLWSIFREAAPHLQQVPSKASAEFVDSLRALFKEALEDAGGEIV